MAWYQMTGQQLYEQASAAVEAGRYNEAMNLLAEVDQAGDVDAKLTTNMRHQIAALKAEEEASAVPEPPAKSAVKQDWVDHVVATTALTEEEAAAKTKAELISMVHGGDEPSAGTSSSTSDDRPDTSGSSVPETGSSSQSPAQDAESLSSQDHLADQAPSSTATSTGGSTQETGPSQPSQPDSSEATTPATSPTQAQTDTLTAARDMIQLARESYDRREWDKVLEYLDEADKLDASVQQETAAARQAVAVARG